MEYQRIQEPFSRTCSADWIPSSFSLTGETSRSFLRGSLSSGKNCTAEHFQGINLRANNAKGNKLTRNRLLRRMEDEGYKEIQVIEPSLPDDLIPNPMLRLLGRIRTRRLQRALVSSKNERQACDLVDFALSAT
jgi:hypothetical protein